MSSFLKSEENLNSPFKDTINFNGDSFESLLKEKDQEIDRLFTLNCELSAKLQKHLSEYILLKDNIQKKYKIW